MTPGLGVGSGTIDVQTARLRDDDGLQFCEPVSRPETTRICVVGLRGIPGVMGGIESHCEQIFPRLKAQAQQYDITIIGRKPYLAGGAYDYQGVRVVPGPEPILNLRSPARSATLHELEQQMLRDVNERHARARPGDLELPARMNSFSVAAGMKLKDKPQDFARKAMQEFNDKAYHSPQDEFQPEWDFSGFVVLARFALDAARDVHSSGPNAATGVSVTDVLPANVTFVSAGSGCSNSSGTVTCTVASLASGADATFTITVTAPATAATITNTATVSAASPTDPNTGNNSSSATTTVQAGQQTADLAINKDLGVD